jgi:iron complex transport system permease protein
MGPEPLAVVRLPLAWTLATLGALVAVLVVSLSTGAAGVGPGEVARSTLSQLPGTHMAKLPAVDQAIIWQLRAPRAVLAALVGGMLAVAGSAYQGVFRNPLADPYLLGVAAGAGLGATAVIVTATADQHTGAWLPVGAFVGAVASVACAYALGRSVGAVDGAALILAGVAVAAFATAAQTFLQQERSESLREVYAWLLGGFDASDWHAVYLAAPYIVTSSAVLLGLRRGLDVLSVGEQEAASLGLDVRRLQLLVLVFATAGTAAAVAVSGLIGFVGIIVPHTLRLLVSSSYRVILPLSLIVGAAFLVGCDVVARSVLAPSEVPIGVVTAFCGAPFFAVLLRSSRRRFSP